MAKSFMKLEEYVNQRSEFPYPSDDQDPKLKLEKEYYVAYNRALVAEYTNNVFELPYAFGKNKRSFREIDQYATGTYPNTKIKDQLIGTGKTKKVNGRHITKMNISWDTLPILPKMFDVMREKNMKQTYGVDSFCIDDDSIQAKENDKAMLKYLVAEDTKQLMQATKYNPQMPINPQEIGIQNSQDVDLYFEVGAYTFKRELASIAACNKTKLISRYKSLQDETFDDLIKFGIVFWKTEIDPTTHTPKIRKCSLYSKELGICPMLIPFSESNEFSNLSKCAEIVPMTILDLRRENPELSAQELIYICQCYSYLNNDYMGLINTAVQSSNADMSTVDPLNRCKVLVLDSQWLSVDIENYVKNSGRTLYKSVDFDFKLSSERKRKGDVQHQKRVVKKFHSKWVIGTDILLSNGIATDVVYYGPDGDRCPSLDFFGAKTGNVSLVERCIAIQDDIDLANIKLRNALATAVPAPRMVIQQGLLDNVFLNGIKQQPQDNMATFRELGYLIINAVDDDGKPLYTNQRLVDFLPMGIQEDINVFTGQILAGINAMREVLGLAQGADGSTPQKYDGNEKTALAMQSSNAALFPTFNCFQYIFENSFTDIVKKWQIVAKDRDIKLSYSPLGKQNMEILSLNEEFTNADYNIQLALGATDQELADLMTDIKGLRALGLQTNFQQGITTSEFIYLSETIKSGNTKQAMWVMAKVEQKKMAAQQAIDQQNQQNNIQGQQQSAQVAEQSKQDTARIAAQEQRKTILLQEAAKSTTAASTALINAYDKEGGPTAIPIYQSIIDKNNAVIMGVLGDGQPSQQSQPEPPQTGQQPPEQNDSQQQVA